MAKKPKAPEAVPAEDAAPETKKKGKKKLVVIVGVVVVLCAGAYAYMSMSKKASSASASTPTTTAGGPIVEENPLTVNLRDGHYLQFTVAIQVNPGKSDKVLTTDQAIVLDILNTQAGGTTEAALLKPGGPARLKANISAALDNEWPGLVQAVYFEQFVMQ
ncbi:MAG TPA: flagellar basal body-associated FliL family protein [Acidimicrobiales bacterium]|nr:flagellar basal body-associated FliL family protein [Acidimicrobiales bacterium]